MKVIELLNKIANSGDYEKETYFKYYDRNAEEYDISLLLYEVIIGRLERGQIDLNDEIEIIEEDKKIEKLEHWVDVKTWVKGNDLETGLEEQSNFNKNVFYKINEIIDHINKGD